METEIAVNRLLDQLVGRFRLPLVFGLLGDIPPD